MSRDAGDDVISQTMATRMSVATIACLMAAVGTAGHCFLLFSLHHNRQFGHQCRVLLLNLSVVSLVNDAIGLPISVPSMITGRQYYSTPVCFGMAYFHCAMYVMLQANCIAVAIQRCVILMSHQLHQPRPHHTPIIVLTLWLAPIIVTMGGIPFFGYSPNQLLCLFKPTQSHSWYSILLICVPCTTTLIAMSTSYIIICGKVRKSRARLSRKIGPANETTPPPAAPTPVADPPQSRRRSSSLPNIRRLHENDIQPYPVAECNSVPGDHGVVPTPTYTSFRDRLTAWSGVREREFWLSVQLLVNFAVFAFVWTPLCLLYFTEGYVYTPPACWAVFSIAGRSYTAINWMLYGLWSRSMRSSGSLLQRMVSKCCCARCPCLGRAQMLHRPAIGAVLPVGAERSPMTQRAAAISPRVLVPSIANNDILLSQMNYCGTNRTALPSLHLHHDQSSTPLHIAV